MPGVTENRLCGSGLEAVAAASREIATGDAAVCIAGGVESMSRAPWVVAKPEAGYERTDRTMHSTTLGWRLVNPRMPEQWTVPLGEGAEILAERYGIARAVQDAFALRSHERAAAAWRAGRFAGEVVPVPGAELDRDESVRDGTSLDALARLRPVFRAEGTVTAGNASPMNDGAAAVLLAGRAGRRGHRGRAAGPHRRPGRRRRRPAPVRRRPRGGGAGGAEAGRHRLGRPGARSSSTRRSPPRRWRAWPTGRTSTGRSSTPTAAPSPSAIRSGRRAPGS